jgi:peptidoglycan/xylan/chitin deacetylase (PgdA/CDA1 family)
MSRFHLTTLLTIVGVGSVLLPSGCAIPRVVATILVLVYVVLFGLGVCFIQFRFFGPVIYRASVGEKVCALTFDDGPDAMATEPLLALLAREGIHAAFFCIGARVLEFPDLACRIVGAGHLLENHTQRHAWWTNFLPTAALSEEISRAQDSIRTATGSSPRYYRPPVGLTSPAVPRVMRQLGLECVGWDVRSLDRSRISAARVVRRVRRGLREGSIILLHDGGVDPSRLLSIVEQVIALARSKGYRFVRLDEMLGHKADVPTTGLEELGGRARRT